MLLHGHLAGRLRIPVRLTAVRALRRGGMRREREEFPKIMHRLPEILATRKLRALTQSWEPRGNLYKSYKAVVYKSFTCLDCETLSLLNKEVFMLLRSLGAVHR